MRHVQLNTYGGKILLMVIMNGQGPNGEDVALKVFNRRQDNTLYPKQTLWFATVKEAQEVITLLDSIPQKHLTR